MMHTFPRGWTMSNYGYCMTRHHHIAAPGAAYIVLLDARNVRQQQVPLDCAIPWNPLELSRYIIHISCSQVSEAKSISRDLRSQKGIVSTPLLRLQQADRGIPGRGRSCHWSKNSPRRTDVLLLFSWLVPEILPAFPIKTPFPWI